MIDLVLQVLNNSAIIVSEGESVRYECLETLLNHQIGRNFSINIFTLMDTASKLCTGVSKVDASRSMKTTKQNAIIYVCSCAVVSANQRILVQSYS